MPQPLNYRLLVDREDKFTIFGAPVRIRNGTDAPIAGSEINDSYFRKYFATVQKDARYHIVTLRDEKFIASMKDIWENEEKQYSRGQTVLFDEADFKLMNNPGAYSSGKSYAEKRKRALGGPSLFDNAGEPRKRRTQNPASSNDDADRKPHYRKERRDPGQHSQHKQQIVKPKKGNFSFSKMFGRKENDVSKHRGDEKHSRHTHKNKKPKNGQSPFSKMFGFSKNRGSNHRSHTEHERLL